MINSILDKVSKELPNEKILNFQDFYPGGKRDEKSRIYLKIKTDKQNIFVKYAKKASKKIFSVEFRALNKVRTNGFSVPNPIALIDQGIIMSEVRGKSLETIIKEKGTRNSINLLKEVTNRIALFHNKYEKNFFKDDIDELCVEITGNRKNKYLKGLIDKVNFGFMHGDLDPFNILFDDKTSEFGLIDWEDFKSKGIQELDILHFVIMLGVICNPGMNYSNLYKLIFGKNKKSLYDYLFEIYCNKRFYSKDVLINLLPLYCDTQNYRLIKAGRNTEDFLYNEFRKKYYES